MFVGGALTVGNSPAENYICHFHETHESGKFYYLRIMCPILGFDDSEAHVTYYTTYRTSTDKKGRFRNIVTQDGIDYEILAVTQQDKYLIINDNDDIDAKFDVFLSLFIEDSLYRDIPEIKILLKTRPELKI